jgi:hypothetical protein
MKTKINQSRVLEERILALENKQKAIALELKTQLDVTLQELKPSKLITNTLKETFYKIKNEPQIKGNLIEVLLSLGGGYLSKKVLVGKSNSTIKSLLGYAVQFFTTKLISKKI